MLAPFALSSNVAYVVRSSSDLNVISSLNENSLTYDVITENSIPLTDFTKYNLMIIHGNVANKDKIPFNQTHALVIVDNTEPFNVMQQLWAGCDVDQSQTMFSKFENLGTKFSEGFADYNFTAYTVTKQIFYLRLKPSYVNRIVLTTGSGTPSGIVAYSELNGTRNVFFGFSDTNYWTSDTKKIFKNSLNWIVDGLCIDSDGDYYIAGNNDASICQNICGLNHNEACLGNNDCSDSDASINPGAYNVFKNCKNDAPIIYQIPDKEIYEGDKLIINISAVDPENNPIIYSINDSRLVQGSIKNIFTWQTNVGDAGEYTFLVEASDGTLKSTQGSYVKINPKNNPPLCLNIQNLNWNEDETITLNLNDYCSDYEGKPINFSVANKSNDSINIAVSNGIASFSAAKDWNGNGFIVFKANDGKDEVLTNRINLSVNPVNDAPVFSGSINDFSWNENTNMSDALNLRNYFSDADTNNLELSVSGNNSIQIVINNWLVSFIPNKNWFGTENIVFSVSDGQYRTDSNSIKLNVLANNMPPQFGELNCTTSILEENNYTCALTGSDAENETISFSVIEKNLMNCNINGNVLSYSGSKDYSGSASCVLRISDARGHSDKVLNFQIENVNDAPVINDYFPKNISKIPSNSSQNFRIIASDIDSTFVIQWHLNNSVVGNESSYTLSRESGNYNLTAIVSDGEFNQSKSWIVSFNPINEFTCSEINGNVCTSNQTCPGNLLNVSDSASCCSVACSEKPPKFNDIQKCSTKNPNAAINIIQPSNNQEFKIGNNMTVELEIKNNANQTINFNAEAYVYDLTKDNSAEKEKQTISIGKGESKRVSFVITLSEELNEKNNYAVYAKISDKTNQSFCNDNYVKIGLTRKSYNYAFENVEIQPIQASCGDFVHANVKISNTGANEDTGYIKIENTNLKINEKSDSFTIKSDRSIAKEFELKIPENARAGEYAFIVSGIFNNGKISYEEKIILGECYSERVVQDNIETISLGEESQQSKVSADNKSRLKLFLVLEIFVFIFIISAMLVLLVSVQRKKSLKDIKKSVKKRKK